MTPQIKTPQEQAVETFALPGVESVTVLEGSSFCRSDRSGDIDAAKSHGLFVRDTRVISTWELRMDGARLEPLAVTASQAFTATFVARGSVRPPGTEPSVVVERRRMVAEGMREDVVVRNFGTETLGAVLTLAIESDFADLFDVKDGRHRPVGQVQYHVDGESLGLSVSTGDRRRGVRIRGHGGHASERALSWRVILAPREEWHTSIEVFPSDDGEESGIQFPLDEPVESSGPSRRLRDWRAVMPAVQSESSALQETLERSAADLGSLRITDPARPDLDVVAAGAPWFMTLFGRDALLTSWMTLPWDPGLARGTLHTLARLQGRSVDALSEEEPGRILHEVRQGIDHSRALGASSIYYGSVDATPLFVMLLGEAARWGLPETDVADLLPAADAALEWIMRYGDLDGDGFVEYQRKTDRGLVNQGWKDSGDAINFCDGQPGRGPIALAEVQAYVYGAYRARAGLASRSGDDATAARWDQRANTLRQRFDETFWLPERGYYAMALDGHKRPVDALASNQGHCLWAGIVPDARVDSVVEQLLSPAMFTGWGVRTLARDMAVYNPVSYHNGSVWPHDNALLVQGLARYGRWDAATRVAAGLLQAAQSFDGRLPELFCGFDDEEMAYPVPYPTSCSPQAWAAATPMALLTALLKLDVADSGTLLFENHLPSQWGALRLFGVHAGGQRVDVDTRG
ncbi:MAG TPA: glycogen debranching N-terminal domain-containing protein [Galbitalea sp.]